MGFVLRDRKELQSQGYEVQERLFLRLYPKHSHPLFFFFFENPVLLFVPPTYTMSVN